MSLRISGLQVECFRGATNQADFQFDTSKPMIVIFGENGTGKSTLVDALDMIANGQIGSLQGRSSTSNRHAPAIGKKSKDVKVALHRGQAHWHGSLVGVKPSVAPTTDLPQIEILRRSQLLKLVEAVPGERYKGLQRFIDVAGIEASEEELDRAAKAVNRELGASTSGRLECEDRLSALWNDNSQPGNSWAEWAESKLGLSTVELDAELVALNSFISATETFNTRISDFETAETSVTTSMDTQTAVIAERDALQLSWTNQTPQIIQTLEATVDLLDNGWSEGACPVCRQSIEPDKLRESVESALGSMKSLRSLHEKERTAANAVVNAQRRVEIEKRQLSLAAQHLADISKRISHDEIGKLNIDVDRNKVILTSSAPRNEDWNTAISDCRRLAGLFGLLTKVREEKQRDRNQLHTIQTFIKAYKEADAQILSLDAIHRKLEAAHKIVRDHRIEFVKDILISVSEEAARLFEFIHPHEDSKSIRLEIDPNKRASLLQYAKFAGQPDVEPQGYFSDSHLDTLGFCFWLALAKRSNPQGKVIVLDDVFTSVDSAHLGRIIELLDVECDNFAQVFIFTHNRNWFDRYRFSQAAGRKVDRIELLRWSPSCGVRYNKTKLEIDEVAELAKQFESDGGGDLRQRLASRCGVLLEALLDCISKQYRGSVPHTVDGNYTLNDLIGSVTKVVKVLEIRKHAEPITSQNENEVNVFNVKTEFEALKALGIQVRNGIGCHFNQVAANLSDSEVAEFAGAAIGFANAIVCSHGECGQIPQSLRGSYYQCGCNRTRLILTKTP